MVYGKRNDNFAVQKAQKNRGAKGDEHKNDDSVNNVSDGIEVKFEVGDMVWGKIEPYPWWPGKIYNEAWAVPSVRKKRKEGYVLVAFFGDNSCAWFDPKELLPFDPHYDEKSKQTNANALLYAVEEAENEVSMRAALGMACHCRNLISFQPVNFFDWFYAVEIKGYDSSGVYSMHQIRSARDWFQPVMTLFFLRQLAWMPDWELHKNVDWIKGVAIFTAYRMAVFKETDETLEPKSGDQSKHLSNSTMDFNQQEEVSYHVHLRRSDEISGAVRQKRKFANHVVLTDEPQVQTCISQEKDDLYVVDACHFGQGKGDFCTPYKKEVIVGPMAVGRQVCGCEVISKNTKVSICQKTQSKPNPRMTAAENSEEDNNMHAISCNACLGKSFHNGDHVRDVKRKDFECPGEYSSSVKAIKADKKRRRRRKREAEVICSAKHPYEDLDAGAQESLDRNPTIKSCQTSVFDKEHALISQQEKEKRACHTLASHSVVDKQVLGSTSAQVELRLMVVNLLTLALDHCYGMPQNILRTIQQFFLQFRSIVYQETFVASPSVDEELVEFQFKQTDCPASTLAVDRPTSARSQGQPLDAIPPRKYLEPDDYMMNHQQSKIYDLKKENTRRVQKRLFEPESLTMEKKAGDQQHVKYKSRNRISAPHVTNKVQDVRGNSKPLITIAKPKILILRFPPSSALPSTSELKAKFGCFGPLDLSSTRVSWKSSTCFVGFKCQSDALAAYDNAVHHKSPFGNANINYQLHTLAVSPRVSHKPENLPVNQTHEKNVPLTVGSMKPGAQPKTCLRKPMATTGTRSKCRSVKFVLDGNERSKREQMVKGNNSYCNNPSVSMSPSLASFQNSNYQNAQNSTFRSSPACPNKISNVPGDDVVDEFISFCNAQSREATYKNSLPPPGQNVDISDQMLSNLIRCSEIIKTLESRLGYVPYFL